MSRLRNYLKKHHIEPFPPPEKRPRANELVYSAREIELCGAVDAAMRTDGLSEAASLPFADSLRRFCEWIGYDGKTAYIFLFRDTLLPYVYYRAKGRERVYPWLLSRSSLAALTAQNNADDEIRASIYTALEAGSADFHTFIKAVLPDIRRKIRLYPRAENFLRSMLKGIDAERIIVVESGCAGTFPLLLMSLDDRVDMRMYTTYPYLTGILAGRVFTTRYEENRIFETLASQELYFRFSGIRNGAFYVRKCLDAPTEKQALAEINLITRLASNEK